MKTFVAKPDTIKRDWYVVDAEGKTLGRARFRKLKVYAGASHDHAAQKPQVLDI